MYFRILLIDLDTIICLIFINLSTKILCPDIDVYEWVIPKRLDISYIVRRTIYEGMVCILFETGFYAPPALVHICAKKENNKS